MRYVIVTLMLFIISIPVQAGWEPVLKEVTIEEMSMSLMIPEHWIFRPYEELAYDFRLLDDKMLCTPVIIEEDIWGVTIFIYATEREDFERTVFEMMREQVEDESDVLRVGIDLYKVLVDVDGNEYSSLRVLFVIEGEVIAYGVVFHRDGVRYEIYYSPAVAADFGENYEKFIEVLDTLKFN